MEHPRIPDAQIVYGTVIYWLSILAASISVTGPLLAMTFPNSAFMEPQYLFQRYGRVTTRRRCGSWRVEGFREATSG